VNLTCFPAGSWFLSLIQINEGLAGGSLKPIIAKTFPFEQIVEAHRYMESNQQFGKIVATVG
jgi:NADPH:quinone reductase-like Zn-dependent oxidoreductase